MKNTIEQTRSLRSTGFILIKKQTIVVANRVSDILETSKIQDLTKCLVWTMQLPLEAEKRLFRIGAQASE